MKKIELVVVLDPRIQVGKRILVEDEDARTQRLTLEVFPERTETFERIGGGEVPSFFANLNLDEVENILVSLIDAGWSLYGS